MNTLIYEEATSNSLASLHGYDSRTCEYVYYDESRKPKIICMSLICGIVKNLVYKRSGFVNFDLLKFHFTL